MERGRRAIRNSNFSGSKHYDTGKLIFISNAGECQAAIRVSVRILNSAFQNNVDNNLPGHCMPASLRLYIGKKNYSSKDHKERCTEYFGTNPFSGNCMEVILCVVSVIVLN